MLWMFFRSYKMGKWKKIIKRKLLELGLHAYRGVYRENNDLTLPYIIYIHPQLLGFSKELTFFPEYPTLK